MHRLTAILLTVLLLAPMTKAVAEERPTIVVNIVIGSMRADDLERFAHNFAASGLRLLMEHGVTYKEAYYNYSTASTASGLATLATGAYPSVHGVVGEKWWNPTDAQPISLIFDSKSSPVPFSTGARNVSPQRLTAPTYGDMLTSENPYSKQFTIAIDDLSSIVLNGRRGMALWVERNQTDWTTSSAYADKLPEWIEEYNKSDKNETYRMQRWSTLYSASKYHNWEVAVVEGISDKSTHLIRGIGRNIFKSLYGNMSYTPAGNTMLLRFAEQLVLKESLGKDGDTDVLNIYLDTARNIAQTYGPESIEYEDMIYRLDNDLIWFIGAIHRHIGINGRALFVISSDHGTSPSYNQHGSEPRHRFNHRQMEVIVNAYLGGRYGTDDYVVGYANNSLYLNHTILADKKLDYATICDEVATFLLKLQGVSTAISATSLRNASFMDGRCKLMQHSFFGARSGDILIDLVPGCIIEDDDYRSLPTSGYVYDRHVPLIIAQIGMQKQSVERVVEMTELAPTLCHIMGVSYPWASDQKALSEFY